MRFALLVWLLVPSVLAAPPTTCALPGEYERALCAYQQRDFVTAEQQFRAISEREEKAPETLRAAYFLARTLMKTGRFEEASQIFIRIHALDRAFYATWNCDFLLGECRRALGM